MKDLFIVVSIIAAPMITAADYQDIDALNKYKNEVKHLESYCNNLALDKVHAFYKGFKKLNASEKQAVVHEINNIYTLHRAYGKAFVIKRTEHRSTLANILNGTVVGAVGELLVMGKVCFSQTLDACIRTGIDGGMIVEATLAAGISFVIGLEAWFYYKHNGFQMTKDFKKIQEESAADYSI